MRAVETYEVFARYEPTETLRHVGSVRAASRRDAGVYAYTLYDEWKWREMVVAQRAAVKFLVRPEGAVVEEQLPGLAAGRYVAFTREDYAEPLRYRGELEVAAPLDGPAARRMLEERFGPDILEGVLIDAAALYTVVRRDHGANKDGADDGANREMMA